VKINPAALISTRWTFCEVLLKHSVRRFTYSTAFSLCMLQGVCGHGQLWWLLRAAAAWCPGPAAAAGLLPAAAGTQLQHCSSAGQLWRTKTWPGAFNQHSFHGDSVVHLAWAVPIVHACCCTAAVPASCGARAWPGGPSRHYAEHMLMMCTAYWIGLLQMCIPAACLIALMPHQLTVSAGLTLGVNHVLNQLKYTATCFHAGFLLCRQPTCCCCA
jgi:hypothetical protein